MVMGAYARKHSRYHRSVECETDGALQILWNLWELHRFAKILQICETGVMEKQETQRPNVLADVEEIYEYSKDTSTGVSKDISEKCVLGKWLIEEPYALIGHVRFCEGLLRLEPLIAKQYMMKGCEKVETKSTRRDMDYMTLKEASEKWGVTPRRINYLCASGRIPGAVKMATIWLIPKDAQKPQDKRYKKNKST